MDFPGAAAPAGGWTDWHEPSALDALDLAFQAEPLAGLDALLTTVEAARGPAPTPLRCLEGHAADCSACCPPPPVDKFASYVLLGQNGTKRLRRAVLLTREWNTTADREAAATLAEADGDPHGVARVLRGKSTWPPRWRCVIVCPRSAPWIEEASLSSSPRSRRS
jgi:hypothetical protein